MKIGGVAETGGGERRVAMVPAAVPALRKLGLDVVVERDAGRAAGYDDDAFAEEGATLLPDAASVFGEADVIACLHAPSEARGNLRYVRPDQVLVGLLDPLGAPRDLAALSERGAVAFALELLPRITRAQSMDALTSMATIAGYEAVLLAATTLDRLFPLMMTAAGTIPPARMLVIGAGVAGLQAIATAKRLGAVVQAYDVRPAVKEQVESLGVRFLDLDLGSSGAEGSGGYARAREDEFYRKQGELLARVVAESDVVITTAAVPGSRAPLLVTADAVRRMRPGSVVVDLAAETGGNCELTRPGETVAEGRVSVIGARNLAARAPHDASRMYARNVAAFLGALVVEGRLDLDRDDEIVRGTLVTRGGEVVHPRVREALGLTEPRERIV